MSVRVLVVDDDEVSREVLSVLLQGEGYQTEAVDSGEAALMYLKMVRPLPEVVLADMQMPGTSGDELARRMRETCGAGRELEGDAGREFDGFLLKPLSMEELAAAIAGGTAARERRQKDAGVTVLDEAVYGKLSAAMRPVKLNELYALCVNDAEARIGRMREAATDGEDGAYRREAHALQGGCGMVGAREMQALATSLEQRGLRGDHVASLDELTMACERLRRILIEHAGGHIRTEVSGDDTR
jgi:CheY-like chemotaxis protein